MPIYAYRGVDAAGKAVRGHLDAETPRTARARLRLILAAGEWAEIVILRFRLRRLPPILLDDRRSPIFLRGHGRALQRHLFR